MNSKGGHDMDGMTQLLHALGAEAVGSLRQRRLLWELPLQAGAANVDPATRLDRTLGVVLGLAAGNADGDGKVGVETQTFVLSAEAWLDHGWRAPEALAEQLSRELHTLRTRGLAIDAAVEAHRNGVPWHLAAPTSYGNAALGRATAIGAVFAGHPSMAALAGSVDAAVTHAERRATGASAALAAIVASLIRRDVARSPIEVVRGVVGAWPDGSMRELLVQALSSLRDGGALARHRQWGIRADETLALSVWAALSSDDPAAAVSMATTAEHGSHTAGAVTGTLVGAIHGAAALPRAWHTDVEGAADYSRLARRVATNDVATATATGDHRADIWFLLDRSGSMQQIAGDVVSGFDGFFASQRATRGKASVTVVQFDDQDRHEVIVDAQPIDAVGSIAGRFEPRGSTPLYDAIGLLLDRAERRGGDAADQLVVVFTDGYENASREWTQQRLFARIGELRDRGWTFVFLGANQDSYSAGGDVGFSAGNTSNFTSSPIGVQAAYSGLQRTVSDWRGKSREQRRRDKDDFWSGRKEAEEDL
jgi:ADP-ribosylglycohydrolase